MFEQATRLFRFNVFRKFQRNGQFWNTIDRLRQYFSTHDFESHELARSTASKPDGRRTSEAQLVDNSVATLCKDADSDRVEATRSVVFDIRPIEKVENVPREGLN